MRVVPVRFTTDVDAMRRFCEALGLQANVVAESGNWVALDSDAPGGVGLHPAAAAESPRVPGQTDLSFEATEPLEKVRDRLAGAGFDAVVLDEAFGRSLRVVDPDGVVVQVNEAMTDPHGYVINPADAQRST